MANPQKPLPVVQKPIPAHTNAPIPSSQSLGSLIQDIARRHDNDLADKVKELLTFELHNESNVSKFQQAIEGEKKAVAEAASLPESNRKLPEEERRLSDEKQMLSAANKKLSTENGKLK